MRILVAFLCVAAVILGVESGADFARLESSADFEIIANVADASTDARADSKRAESSGDSKTRAGDSKTRRLESRPSADSKTQLGFYGRLSLGAGLMNYKSHLFQRGDRYYRGSAPTPHNIAIPVVAAELNYAFNERFLAYFKNAGWRDVSGAKLGVKIHQSAALHTDIAFVQSLFNKEFDDPLALNVRRERVSANKSGVAIAQTYQPSALHAIFGEYGAVKKTLARDAGSDKRDGWLHRLELGGAVFGQRLSASFYKMAAVSSAQSYTGYKLSLAPFVPLGFIADGLILSPIFAYGEFKHGGADSTFGVLRKDTERDIGAVLIKRNFLGKESLTFNTTAIHKRVDSSIAFYNERYFILMMSVGVKF